MLCCIGPIKFQVYILLGVAFERLSHSCSMANLQAILCPLTRHYAESSGLGLFLHPLCVLALKNRQWALMNLGRFKSQMSSALMVELFTTKSQYFPEVMFEAFL